LALPGGTHVPPGFSLVNPSLVRSVTNPNTTLAFAVISSLGINVNG
jgi:hypothetical protein